VAVAVGVGAVLAVYVCLRSRVGLGLMAVRDSEPASEMLLYLNLLRISPDAAFSINWTAYTIFIVVIGGLGTLEGPIVGTVVFFLLRELLSDYGAWYMILLGGPAVLVMMRYPQGLRGFVAERWDLRFFPVQRRVRLR
jgi:branched-chain amino acid transport system permease protein